MAGSAVAGGALSRLEVREKRLEPGENTSTGAYGGTTDVPRRLQRLDAELVRRSLARSREQAQQLIAAGRVEVHGVRAEKAATGVAGDASIRVVDADDGTPDYVSRGGHKLAGALAAFPQVRVQGRRCLDAGASTGGFTDVLLRAGAAEVVAVDVGYGQLAWPVRTDERVRVHDRTNVRALDPSEIGGAAELTVADLSFISLAVVLPALTACTLSDGDLLPMVKPQFEVGRDRLASGGVVRDPGHRADAVVGVVQQAAHLGWYARGVTRSPLPGPSGNVEFFVWLRTDAAPGMTEQQIRDVVTQPDPVASSAPAQRATAPADSVPDIGASTERTNR